MKHCIAAAVAALVIWEGAAASESALDSYIISGMKDWGVPGLAAVVVSEDGVVYRRGFGVRALNDPEPVDEDTIFNVASCTKQVTSGALASLVDEGRLSWERPVRDYWPELQFADEWVSDALLVADLVDNGSGFSSHHTLRTVARNRTDYVRRLSFEEPQAPFRSAYRYASDMFIAAGVLIDIAAGRSYEAYVQRSIFSPLAMSRTSLSGEAATGRENVAQPHMKYAPGYWAHLGSDDPVFAKADGALEAGEIYQAPFGYNYAVGASTGGLNTTAADFGAWLSMLVNKGRHRGKEILSEENVAAMLSLQTAQPPAGDDDAGPDTLEPAGAPLQTLRGYGRGFAVGVYRGATLAAHEGWNSGFRCYVAILPERGVAVAVFVNLGLNGNPAKPFGLRLLDHFASFPETDWSALYLEKALEAEQRTARLEEAQLLTRNPDAPPSLATERYLGVYANPQYGALVIEASEDGALLITLGRERRRPARHWAGDKFAYWSGGFERARGFVSFMVNKDDQVLGLTLSHWDGDIEFYATESLR